MLLRFMGPVRPDIANVVSIHRTLPSDQRESGAASLPQAYDLKAMEKTHELVLSFPVSLADFTRDEKRLILLTSKQVVYVVDPSLMTAGSVFDDQLEPNFVS
jgi:hypothetical protein